MRPSSHLELLSPELLSPILCHLPDLESLDSLLRASPASCRLFDVQGSAVLKAVLNSGSTHTYTCSLVRIIALIRANALPPTMVRHETSPHRWKPPRWVQPQANLTSEISITVLRGILVTNRMIQRLTFGCLEYYLNKLRSLRPSNSAKCSYDSMPFAQFNPDLIGPWQEKSAGEVCYYPVHDIDPPSWLEQQGALRAFWRVQLSRDLRSALDVSSIVWPEEEGFDCANQTSPRRKICVTCLSTSLTRLVVSWLATAR